MSQSYAYVEEVPDTTYDEFLGPKENRIAVLGAFDTWSYMHKICTEVVKLGFVAVTSRYIYRKSEKTASKYYRTPRDPDGMDMNEFLKTRVIKISEKAIIVYSVPAAHYNEADWCDKIEDLETLGVAFVRGISNKNCCMDCVSNFELDFAYCQGEGNAWECIEKPPCPFKSQGIAKSQLEYFLNRKEKMKLICIEKIEKVEVIIDKFLKGNLLVPHLYPYVFEFRIDINEDDYKYLITYLNEIVLLKEEKIFHDYEYIDHYFKPNNIEIYDWLEKKRTIRIREFLQPFQNDVDVFSSELRQIEEGFICHDPFGQLKWYTGSLERSKKLLKDYHMNLFLKVIKKGRLYFFNEKGPYKLYIEEIKVDPPTTDLITYGYSLEIEIWITDLKNYDEIICRKNKILEKLSLKGKIEKHVPIQEFIYEWMENM